MVGEIEGVLQTRNHAGVHYLVDGGVAVVLHGHLRTIADLNLMVRLERENLRHAVAVLKHLGYRPRAPVPVEAVVEAEQRESWIRE